MSPEFSPCMFQFTVQSPSLVPIKTSFFRLLHVGNSKPWHPKMSTLNQQKVTIVIVVYILSSMYSHVQISNAGSTEPIEIGSIWQQVSDLVTTIVINYTVNCVLAIDATFMVSARTHMDICS